MKLRAALGILVLAVTVSACGGSPVPTASSGGGDGGSVNGAASAAAPAPGGSDGSAVAAGATSGDFCTRLVAAQKKLDDFNSSMGSGDMSKANDVIAADITVFQELAQGGPAQVQPALTDIVQVLRTAQTTLADPAHADASAMQAIATKLPADLGAMASYVSANCQS